MKRDWKANPPTTQEEGFELALWFADDICSRIPNGPRPVRTAIGVDIVWPDGEVSNTIEVELIQ